MKNLTKKSLRMGGISLILGLVWTIIALAATTPSQGTTATYSILSSTYTNTVPGTTINGDIGFTTGPAVVPAGVHLSYGSVAPYAVAGTDQANVLSALALQPCTYTFAAGAVDLATDVGHGAIGVYTPGVYCTTAASAATIWAAGIVLDGAGTYIFRIDGALDTVANSSVTLSGASACDVFWTPTAATTLGANSTFVGTDIDVAGITIGSNVVWSGRALAFGGTVTTAVGDSITTPVCGVTPASLHIIKQVVNTGGGTAIPSDFILHVKNTGSGVDLSGTGTVSPGTLYSLTGATYVVSEIANASYVPSFSGDCSATGSITLSPNQDKTCTVTNTYIPPINNNTGGGGWSLSMDVCPNGDHSPSYYDRICEIAPVVSTGSTVLIPAAIPPVVRTGAVIPTIVYEPAPEPTVRAQAIPTVMTVIPSMPHAGLAPVDEHTPWNTWILVGFVLSILFGTGMLLKKRIG